jgi:hypothetical protein
MAFNADEHAAALIPPVLVAGGKEYRGTLLSVEEVAVLWGNRPKDDAKLAETRAFTRRCVEAWFPTPWLYRLLGLTNPAWNAFRKLPDKTQLAAIESFSLAQRIAAPGASLAPLSESE